MQVKHSDGKKLINIDKRQTEMEAYSGQCSESSDPRANDGANGVGSHLCPTDGLIGKIMRPDPMSRPRCVAVPRPWAAVRYVVGVSRDRRAPSKACGRCVDRTRATIWLDV